MAVRSYFFTIQKYKEKFGTWKNNSKSLLIS
nr:MAG TPA: hypothetical protein [Caudoviricetes sp.]